MSFVQFLLDKGVGTLQFRLAIEGWPDQYVTSGDLVATATDTREVRRGLSFEGGPFTLSETVKIQDASIEVASTTVKIEADEDDNSIASFAKRPIVTSWLMLTVDETDVTWTVSSSAEFTTNNYYHMGTECVKVTAKPTATTITVTRAQWDTQAQAHYAINTVGRGLGWAPITDRPGAIRNRRAYVYVYEGDDELGDAAATTNNIKDGTLLWRGDVLRPPVFDGTSWNLTIDPVTKLLDQKVGTSAKDPIGIRGIYHQWSSPFHIHLNESTTGSYPTVGGADWDNTVDVHLTGFHESNAAFLTALNTEIATQIAAEFTTKSAVVVVIQDEATGYWHVEITSGGKFVGVYLYSAIEGRTDGVPHTNITGTEPVNAMSNNVTYYLHFDQDAVGYNAGWFNAHAIEPRSYWGAGWLFDTAALDSAPSNRIHLNRSIGIAVGDAIHINIESADQQNLVVTAVDVANAPSIDVNPIALSGVPVFGPAVLLTHETVLTFQREYSEDGTLEDLRAAIVAAAVEANTGETPHLTGQDVETWSEVADAAGGRSSTAHRRYAFYKEHTIRDVFAEEAKLLGGYFRLSSNGKIDFKRLVVRSATDPATVTLNAASILPRPVWPRWSQEPDGIINKVIIERDYNAQEDSYDSKAYEFTDAHSVALHKQRTALTIEPRSRVVSGALDSDEAEDVAQVALYTFGTNYAYVRLTASWALFLTALVGETALITDTRIPDTETGTLGVTDLRAIIVGREWSFPGIGGALTLLVQQGNIAGYAPALRVTTATDNTGDEWQVIVSQSRYAPTGSDDLDFFTVGDYIEVIQFDSYVPNSDTATVVSIDSVTAITVQFDNAAPWGAAYSGSYEVLFRDNGAVQTPTTAQSAYVYESDSTFLLYDGDPTRVLVP